MSHHAGMMKRRRIIALCSTVLVSSIWLTSCAKPKERTPLQHVTLPSRDVQITLPFAPRYVHESAERTLKDELGYGLTDSKFDDQTGLGRIDGKNASGESVRVLIKPGRAEETSILQVFAVPAGGRAGDAAMADVILTRIEDTIWNAQKK